MNFTQEELQRRHDQNVQNGIDRANANVARNNEVAKKLRQRVDEDAQRQADNVARDQQRHRERRGIN